ncbi:MAG: hypothetical protein LBB50_02170 [Oscillospiraceae bacterium]|jgi:hypothetical protein|nr:hypothetical protein [Oscillospiraceae bacterium]
MALDEDEQDITDQESGQKKWKDDKEREQKETEKERKKHPSPVEDDLPERDKKKKDKETREGVLERIKRNRLPLWQMSHYAAFVVLLLLAPQIASGASYYVPAGMALVLLALSCWLRPYPMLSEKGTGFAALIMLLPAEAYFCLRLHVWALVAVLGLGAIVIAVYYALRAQNNAAGVETADPATSRKLRRERFRKLLRFGVPFLAVVFAVPAIFGVAKCIRPPSAAVSAAPVRTEEENLALYAQLEKGYWKALDAEERQAAMQTLLDEECRALDLLPYLVTDKRINASTYKPTKDEKKKGMPKILSIKQALRASGGDTRQRVLAVCYATSLQRLSQLTPPDDDAPEVNYAAAAAAALQQSEFYQKNITIYWDNLRG